jgi:hypothetical protein
VTRGRPAALPEPQWHPPRRESGDGLVVRFFPEEGGRTADFDFSSWPVGQELRRAFAAAFSKLTAPDGTHRSTSTAETTFAASKRFSVHVSSSACPPQRPQDLVPAHLAEFRLAKPRDYIKVKVVLRGVPGITQAFAGALRTSNPPRRSQRLRSYSKREFSSILAAARGQLRDARSRIRANRELLEQWHASQFKEGTEQWNRGYVLEHVARTGDVPRDSSGSPEPSCARLGTVEELVSALHLTYNEMIAGAVLLAGLTGHNVTGISNLTVSHHRADGDDGTGTTRVAIVEIVKRRRGRRRRYMSVPLTDVPDWVLGSAEDGSRNQEDLNTPFGAFATLCEVTADSRAVTGSDRLLIARSVRGGGGIGRHWSFGFTAGGIARVWAASHDLRADPAEGDGQGAAPLAVTWPRLRLTFVQLHQRGVAHTERVLVSEYLLRDRGNISEYRQVVADVLAEQERNAREFGLARTLSGGDIELARRDPAAAAEQLGIDVPTLHRLLDGRLDTALAACVDEHHGPYSPSGTPCRASFLLCLSCPNARATPAHLPVQALAHHKILALRPAMPPARWARRFGLAEAQLRHLLGEFSPARVSDALASAGPADADMIDRLLSGQLDAR